MHFVDRTIYLHAPITILADLHNEEQPKWLLYKNWLRTKFPPEIPKPTSKWTRNAIRDHLTALFKNNCAYCGCYSDKDHDGEVDHFLPKEIDVRADFIYDWNNYVWACHSCNNKKRSFYPLINPCIKAETDEIFFHASDGRYLVKHTAVQDILDKYKLTDEKTYLNGKKCPDRRKFIVKYLKTLLPYINTCCSIYEIEKSIDPDSIDSIYAFDRLQRSKEELTEYLKSEDFILLKMQVFQLFKINFPDFPYTYEDFV